VINGVPDDPDSLIIMESTANGHNHFKDEWDLAVSGESGYYPFFSPWFEEEDYRRPFANEHDLLEFEQGVGFHPRWGEDEPVLLELIKSSYRDWAEEEGFAYEEEFLEQRVLEHLNWRRWAIARSVRASSSGSSRSTRPRRRRRSSRPARRVFDPQLTAAVIKRCEKVTDPPIPTAAAPGPVAGLFRSVRRARAWTARRTKIEIPTTALWVPAPRRAHDEVARWRLWSAPVKAQQLAPEMLESMTQEQLQELGADSDGRIPEGQYIVFCDPASGRRTRRA
jgi:hypothetical protein